MANQFENQKLADLKTDNQQKFFQNVFEKNNGNWSAIKTDLTGKVGFTTAVINNLEFTHNLAKWSNNNKALITVFQKNDQINSMRDIALNLNKTKFIEKVTPVAPGATDGRPASDSYR